ncbi:J domain-containing protein 1 [Cladorrhinum samala]|uniref:J domain-containing protein 1 n=1 Tax=Cladorrhinum samala TaxID=585594 RepID=A0AAV9HUD9_9PEZI|nr:J domain-containing protein 1 [Cladorrhinum samala]
MILKRAKAAFCPANAFVTSLPTSSPRRQLRGCSTAANPWQRRHNLCAFGSQQTRSYASVHETAPGENGKPEDALRWPTSANPTPYEIFGLARDAPYNKARFFQLVKLYHPDLQHDSSKNDIPHLTKLDRYRLIIVANDILSNPQKRRMYDLYNVGWDKQTTASSRYRAADRAWRDEPGNASMNATWEDWERWYAKRDGKKQEPIFVSNGGFAAIILIFVVAGTWAQVVWAGNNSIQLMNMQDKRHANVVKDIHRRDGSTAMLSREGRVENFLRQREFEKWGHDPPGHGHLLPGSSVLPKR